MPSKVKKDSNSGGSKPYHSRKVQAVVAPRIRKWLDDEVEAGNARNLSDAVAKVLEAAWQSKDN